MNTLLLRCYCTFAVVVAFSHIAQVAASGETIQVAFDQPSMDRWMYPHNATPGTRPVAPIFATFGNDAGVDTRHAQFLVGFDTSSKIETNRGPRHYLIERAQFTATVSRDRTFEYDPTADAIETFLPTNHLDSVEDEDVGRPVELFGAGFRNGYEEGTFTEDSPFGNPTAGGRNVFAAGYDAQGKLVDVGNNVGKTGEVFPVFAVAPFAIGFTSTVAAGERVPEGTTLEFELNLSDPLVMQYLQQSLHAGRLRLMLSSLHTGALGGQPHWPEFYTRDSVLGKPPTLLLEVTVVSEADTDRDGLPDDWEIAQWGSLAKSGGEDSDGDGVTDKEEWMAGTNPNVAASVLRILEIKVQPDGVLSLPFQFQASRSYRLEESSDLEHWIETKEATLTYGIGTGLAQWAVNDAPHGSPGSHRLFRLQAR